MTLSVRRVRFCQEADNWLRVLKSRTGLTPNVLCRIGFTLSLEEPGCANPNAYPEDSGREINRYTLLGEYDATYVALLRQRMSEDVGTDSDFGREHDMDAVFRAHMNRGVMLLAARAKSLPDLLAELSKSRAVVHQ